MQHVPATFHPIAPQPVGRHRIDLELHAGVQKGALAGERAPIHINRPSNNCTPGFAGSREVRGTAIVTGASRAIGTSVAPVAGKVAGGIPGCRGIDA